MKYVLLLLVFIFIQQSSYSQGGTWTWMKGANVVDDLGSYGVKGVAAATNEPPARYQCAYWTDKDGNFWIFGGYSYPNSTELNDLWKYDPLTNMWTWVSGVQPNIDNDGEFGTMGVPSTNNYPSVRGWGANCWIDAQNNLWLFAGYGTDGMGSIVGSLNDLWKYNISTNEWTWVNGEKDGSLIVVNTGVQGVPSVNNKVGGKNECKSSWVDKQDLAWIFGGSGSNELWNYNAATNIWTWMKGDNLSSSYGVLGVEAATNMPDARASYTKWIDKNDNMYLFAGIGFGTSNDVWRYNKVTNNWTWISGANSPADSGDYIAKCKQEENEFPAARYENQTTRTNACTDVFWTFGGFALNDLNDLWLYNASTNKWTWVSGDSPNNVTAVYGTKGVPNAANKPGGRGGIGIWSDKQNNLWVFGGLTFSGIVGHYNDLWRFEPDANCFKADLGGSFSFTKPVDTIICRGEATSMSLPPDISFAITPADNMSVNFDSTAMTLFPTITTTYTIVGQGIGPCPGRDTLIFTIVVDQGPTAAFIINPVEADLSNPVFTLTNTSSNAVHNEWIYNNAIFSTQINTQMTFAAEGTYCFKLAVSSIEGCKDTVVHCASIIDNEIIYIPNAFSPNSDGKNDKLLVKGSKFHLLSFHVFDRFGGEVYTSSDVNQGWDGTYRGVKCDAGVYYYVVDYESRKKVKKMLKGDVSLVR